jgi:DNA topoisomerase-6 subunit B
MAEKLYTGLQNTKLKAPSTDCLSPMGAEAILQGLLRGVKAEFYTASTRPPAVYRGNPFQIEIGVAYGGELGVDKHDVDPTDAEARGEAEEATSRLIRFANRVPLLYQQSSCCLYKAVVETKWNHYGLSQSSGSLPRAPMVILIHMASVWVPFISEGKEAIADYDEIRKEVRLGISECGRRIGLLLKRKKRKAEYGRRRDVFTRYIEEVVAAAKAMADVDEEAFRKSLVDLSKSYTAQADMEFDEHGKVVKRSEEDGAMEDTIIVEREAPAPDPMTLFGEKAGGGKRRKKIGVKQK